MNKNFIIDSGHDELFERVRPLWEELRKFHGQHSSHFSKELSGRDFEERKNEIKEKAYQFQINIIRYENEDIGYCITTISVDRCGEIDSLFVKENFRKNGLGKRLTDLALNWMDKENVKEKSIFVIAENEKAIEFYRQFDFFPRNVHLYQKVKT